MPGERLHLIIPQTMRKKGFGKSCEALYNNLSITYQTGDTPELERVTEPLLYDERESLIARGKPNIFDELRSRLPNPDEAWIGVPAYQT